MSSSRTTTAGVMTREQVKASAQTMASIDELAKKVDDLTKRRRNNSRQAGPAKETMPESEAAGTAASDRIMEKTLTQSVYKSGMRCLRTNHSMKLQENRIILSTRSAV